MKLMNKHRIMICSLCGGYGVKRVLVKLLDGMKKAYEVKCEACGGVGKTNHKISRRVK